MLFLVSFILLGILGLVFGLLLVYSSKKYAVPVEPRVQRVYDVLPKINCGACGYSGCMAYAEAVVHSYAVTNLCVPGGEDVAQAVAALVDGKRKNARAETRHALLRCQGSVAVSPECATYNGIATCRASAVLNGPHKACRFGCLGLGDCVRVCPTSAIEIDSTTHLPVIESSQCIACGKCVAVCPRAIMDIVPSDKDVHILCSSHDKGIAVKNSCSKGCITCGVCETVCPVHAITITDDLPHIDYTTCTNCGICAGKCPTQAILHFFSLKHA